MFNHTMVYDGIREADLTEACVELTVWDRDRLASNLLGGLRLGAGTGTHERVCYVAFLALLDNMLVNESNTKHLCRCLLAIKTIQVTEGCMQVTPLKCTIIVCM